MNYELMKNYLPAGATLWTLYIKEDPLLAKVGKGFLIIEKIIGDTTRFFIFYGAIRHYFNKGNVFSISRKMVATPLWHVVGAYCFVWGAYGR